MQKKVIQFILSLIVFSTMIFSACENDDICLEETTTPQLIVRFYDKDDVSNVKVVNSLYVWAYDKDSLYSNQETDSIVLPFNLNADEIAYHLSNGIHEDILTIKYTRNEIFLSRSCGYIMYFKLQNGSQITQNWLDSISIVADENTINNEIAAHVKIFH